MPENEKPKFTGIPDFVLAVLPTATMAKLESIEYSPDLLIKAIVNDLIDIDIRQVGEKYLPAWQRDFLVRKDNHFTKHSSSKMRFQSMTMLLIL